MSEPGYDFDDGEGFDPDGLELEPVPLGPVALAAEMVEERQRSEQEIDPGWLPAENLSEQALEAQSALQAQASQALDVEAFEQGLLERVAGEAGDSYGPRAIRQAASEVDAARQRMFQDALAVGWDVQQALAAADELEPQAIRVALERQAYLKFSSSDPSLRQWRAGRESQARKDAAEGRPPRADVFDSPSWRRMNEQTSAHAERQRQHDAIWRQHFKNRGYR